MRVLAAAVTLYALTLPAFADRAATPEERTKIEQVLRDAGFVAWEEIEFDDGMWEVDDAHMSDGREFDLKLDPSNFAIVDRREDDPRALKKEGAR